MSKSIEIYPFIKTYKFKLSFHFSLIYLCKTKVNLDNLQIGVLKRSTNKNIKNSIKTSTNVSTVMKTEAGIKTQGVDLDKIRDMKEIVIKSIEIIVRTDTMIDQIITKDMIVNKIGKDLTNLIRKIQTITIGLLKLNIQ